MMASSVEKTYKRNQTQGAVITFPHNIQRQESCCLPPGFKFFGWGVTAAAPEDLRDLREKSDINSFIKAIKRQPPVNCNRKLYCNPTRVPLL